MVLSKRWESTEKGNEENEMRGGGDVDEGVEGRGRVVRG